MKIEKAIEILDIHTKDPCSISFDELKEAEELGLEALKREKRNRDDPDLVLVGLLPGETEDSSQEAEEINPEPTNP